MIAAGTKSGRSRLASSAAAFEPATSVSKLAMALAVSSTARLRAMASRSACRLALRASMILSAPSQSPRAVFSSSVDIRCPFKLRRNVGGAPGIMSGGVPVAQPLGLEIEAAQAEQPHLGVVEHRLELLPRAVMVAFQQRRLRVEQHDQRLLVGADQLRRLLVHLAGKRTIAGAGRDHPGRQCLVAAIALAHPEVARDHVGARPDGLGQPPEDHHAGDDGDHRDGRDHQADLILVAAEGDDHVARPVGQPGKAQAEQEDERRRRRES